MLALLLPLLYAFARKLWRDAEDEETPHGRRWWRTVAMMLLGMALLCTVLGLMFDPRGGSLMAALIDISIAGRTYQVACREGEEENLRAAARLAALA